MTGIDFPSNPSVNQQFSAFGNVWIWNGSSWRKVSRTAVVGAQGNTGQTGSQGPAVQEHKVLQDLLVLKVMLVDQDLQVHKVQ